MAQDDEKFKIGFVFFPHLTQLDFAGPYEVFARVPGVQVFLTAKEKGPVISETGLTLIANDFFQSTPQLDLICVPGGMGTLAASADEETLAFLRSQVDKAKWVTSVCTGSLILGAAGLLNGYRAVTHWTSMDILPFVGAIPVEERVVKDRNRITGGGMTSGIDFGLYVVGEIFGTELAEIMQLIMEYNPKPPFKSGHPSEAPSAIVEKVRYLGSADHQKWLDFYSTLKF